MDKQHEIMGVVQSAIDLYLRSTRGCNAFGAGGKIVDRSHSRIIVHSSKDDDAHVEVLVLEY